MSENRNNRTGQTRTQSPFFEPEPVVLPITDVLDLHTFRPGDLPHLLDDYFEACLENGIHTVRVVHGKGTGRLRQWVMRILERHPRVAAFHPAPPEAGGWGAMVVSLQQAPRPERESDPE